MRRFLLAWPLAMMSLSWAASAETVAAAHTIRSDTVIGAEDVKVLGETIPGTISAKRDVIGLEARVILFAGRPIRPSDVGQPAVIRRNDIVPLVFARGGLRITAEGRALGRAGVGDRLRVMNLSSRSTVTGRVGDDGGVTVGAGQ